MEESEHVAQSTWLGEQRPHEETMATAAPQASGLSPIEKRLGLQHDVGGQAYVGGDSVVTE